MIKTLLKTTLLFLSFASNVQGTDLIPAEIPTAVTLSNRDINRIVCPGPISDLIFSKEKGLTGHFSGNNGFIKFAIEDTGDDYVYADNESELFVVCNGAVYTILVTPSDIPSTTLRLAPPAGDSFKKNIARYKNLPLEKQVLQLIREVYTNSYPASYRIASARIKIELSQNFDTTLLQTVDVEGVGLRLKNYQISSVAAEDIHIDEADFLSPALGESILAIAVYKHTLTPGENTNVFIVEQRESIR